MSTGQDVLSQEDRKNLMDAWKISVDVAMHFNGLLLGFRLKAIGGIAVGAVISTGFKFADLGDHALIPGLFVWLAVIWLLVGVVDFFYYYPLLAGAVDESLRLERRLGNVHIGHLIERRVREEGQPKDDIESIVPYNAKYPTTYPSCAIWVFYGVPAVSLIGLAVFALL